MEGLGGHLLKGLVPGEYSENHKLVDIIILLFGLLQVVLKRACAFVSRSRAWPAHPSHEVSFLAEEKIRASLLASPLYCWQIFLLGGGPVVTSLKVGTAVQKYVFVYFSCPAFPLHS